MFLCVDVGLCVKVCGEGSVFENCLFHLSATWVLLCLVSEEDV